MKFITVRVLCEGPTERNFITQVLAPYLKLRKVFAKPEPLCRGNYGIVPYGRLRKAIKTDLGRSRREHEFVTTMIDLYKMVITRVQRRSRESRSWIGSIGLNLEWLKTYRIPGSFPIEELSDDE